MWAGNVAGGVSYTHTHARATTSGVQRENVAWELEESASSCFEFLPDVLALIGVVQWHRCVSDSDQFPDVYHFIITRLLCSPHCDTQLWFRECSQEIIQTDPDASRLTSLSLFMKYVTSAVLQITSDCFPLKHNKPNIIFHKNYRHISLLILVYHKYVVLVLYVAWYADMKTLLFQIL